MNTIARAFQPIIKTFISIGKHLPTRKNLALRRALHHRRALIAQLRKVSNMPDWRVTSATRLNDPVFVVAPEGALRVRRRTVHARNGKFCFSLGKLRRADEIGVALACDDPQAGLTYLVLAPHSGKDSMYISLDPAEARKRAVAVLPLAS